MQQSEIERLRKRHNIRPLNDTILDAVRSAVKKAGSVYGAAPLLGVAAATIHKRLRQGYSDGGKAIVNHTIDERNKAVCTYDWGPCDRERKRKNV